MKPEVIVASSIFIAFCIAELARTNLLNKPGQRRKDAVVEVIGTLVLLVVTQPLVLLAGGLLAAALLPEHQGALGSLPVPAQVGLLLVFDDMTQYWWHRITHNVKWLYELHRPHHDAEYMSIRIVYRNNIFYYFLMPGLWLSGAFIYLGMGKVYAFYLMTKLLVICGAHSDLRWDRALYKNRFFSPIMWVLERTISTPATHSAHHGRHMDDGVTHYKGNYGNLLFFWDVLFGTARITRRYPESYGVENLAPVSAARQLLWPLVRDKKS
ncbi:MAG: sterol desaturase family protein [Gammaproteobacteria bacterium]|nr:sterol desaturase family protein [Gammaproteobacteria bacterium]